MANTVAKKEYGYLSGYTLHKIDQLEELQPGDHIAFPRGLAYKDPTFWHHAVFESADSSSSTITIIHFYNTSPKTLDASLALMEAFARIRREELPMSDDVYRVHYDDPKEALSGDVTLERARSRLGEGKYNVWTWNCEHFATWCKTGNGRCGQVQPAKRLLGALVSTSSVKGASTGIVEVMNPGSVLTAVKDTYEAGTRLAGGAARAAADSIGFAAILATLLSFVIETIFTAVECLEAKQRLMNGKINQREFDDIVGKRVAEGVGDIAGGVGGLMGGATAGALLGPWGALLGSILGGMSGSFWGRLIGWALGKAGVAIRDSIEWKITNMEIKKTKAACPKTKETSNCDEFEFFSKEYHSQVRSLLFFFISAGFMFICLLFTVLLTL